MSNILKELNVKSEEQRLDESRPTQLMHIIGALAKNPLFEKTLSLHYLSDGITCLVRSKDGNAYEIILRPAQYAQYHEKFTKNDSD